MQRDKLLRTMDYSKAVKDKNKEIISRKPATFPRAKEQDDMLSKRKLVRLPATQGCRRAGGGRGEGRGSG